MPKHLGKLQPLILTEVERDAIANPLDHELIFNSTLGGFQFWDATEWKAFFTEGETIVIPPSQIGGGASSMVISFASGGSKHVSSTSGTYESLAHAIYGGSDVVGVIQNFNLNAWADGGSSVDVRIIDLNTGLTVAQLVGITSMNEANVQSMGAIGNLPTTPSVFEIQGRKVTGGGGAKLFIASLEMTY